MHHMSIHHWLSAVTAKTLVLCIVYSLYAPIHRDQCELLLISLMNMNVRKSEGFCYLLVTVNITVRLTECVCSSCSSDFFYFLLPPRSLLSPSLIFSFLHTPISDAKSPFVYRGCFVTVMQPDQSTLFTIVVRGAM